jgi:deazaflavin-dependent oxidoreductase (nitroreductase family)
MEAIRRTIRRFSKTEWMRRLMQMFLQPLDTGLGRVGLAPTERLMGSPLCYLTTTGRRSGQPRTVPLIYMCNDDGHPIVVGTNYGTEHDPAWALNLDADPGAELRIGKETSQVVARRLSPDEASAIWGRFDAEWPGYERYREIAHRPIKAYALEPASDH